MDNLEKILLDFFAVHLTDEGGNEPVYVAFSGGRDSVVLLYALCRLRDQGALPDCLRAIHVHHGISPNADQWADFCAAFCAQNNVVLEIARVQLSRHDGEGLEAAARQARYAAFAAYHVKQLVLAHHRDDQSETVLLNLLRGAGVAGAAGMPVERGYLGMRLWRPLLMVPRLLIEAYAHQHSLQWVDDESNADTYYRRNFLRNQIFPALEKSFPGAAHNLARAAAHFAEGKALLDMLAEEDFQHLSAASGSLSLSAFNMLSVIRARNLLRWCWTKKGFRPPQTLWLEECLEQLRSARIDAEICLSTSDGELHVYRGQIHMLARQSDCDSRPVVVWRGEAGIGWKGGRVRFVAARGQGLSRQKLAAHEVIVQVRQGGEKLRLDPKRPRRSLKNLFQEAAIPPWERINLPYLWCGGKLVWVGNIGYESEFQCADDEDGVALFWDAPQCVC